MHKIHYFGPSTTNSVVGFIPISGKGFQFGMPWHDCLMPLAPNFTMVERAVLECAYVGCNAIVIVSDLKMRPMIKNRVGDFVCEPASQDDTAIRLFIKVRKSAKKNEHYIPIYYMGIVPREADVRPRNTLYYAMYAAERFTKMAKRYSSFLPPTLVYVTFPSALIPPSNMLKYRPQIQDLTPDQNYFSHQGKTIKDGYLMPFTARPDAIAKTRLDFKNKQHFEIYVREDISTAEKGKLYYTPASEVVETLEENHNGLSWELDEYYQGETWDGYRQFLAFSKVDWEKESTRFRIRRFARFYDRFIREDFENLGNYETYLEQEERRNERQDQQRKLQKSYWDRAERKIKNSVK